jgi:hypothetical protein
MKTYKLSLNSEFAQEFFDGIATGIWAHTKYNQDYLAWLAEGNKPEPAEL